MPTHHIVQPGDCFTRIARLYGFRSYRTIYDHPQNARLKSLRPDPNVLLPGDRVFVPDKVQKIANRPTGAVHTFKVQAERIALELVISIDDAPLTNAAYELTVGDQAYRGATDGDGVLRHEIDWRADTGRLSFDEPALVWDLQIGYLDPTQETTGVQQRLHNRGFRCGEADGTIGPRTQSALRQFQAGEGLTVTGSVDSSTRAALDLRERVRPSEFSS